MGLTGVVSRAVLHEAQQLIEDRRRHAARVGSAEGAGDGLERLEGSSPTWAAAVTAAACLLYEEEHTDGHHQVADFAWDTVRRAAAALPPDLARKLELPVELVDSEASEGFRTLPLWKRGRGGNASS